MALRLALKNLPVRDFVRAELRALLADLVEEEEREEPVIELPPAPRSAKREDEPKDDSARP